MAWVPPSLVQAVLTVRATTLSPRDLRALHFLTGRDQQNLLYLHKHNLSDPQLKLASRKPYQWPALAEPNPFWPNRIRIMASLCQV
jgi:hypothetical protein